MSSAASPSASLSSPSASHSSYALSIEEAATPASAADEVKPLLRRSVVLSVAALVAVVVVVAIMLSVVLTRSSSSSSSSSSPSWTSPVYSTSTITVSRSDDAASLWVPANASTTSTTSRADASDAHTFHWLFPQRNLDWLDAEFAALTDPTSSRYGQWHSYESLMQQVGPSADDKATVLAWLVSQGVEAAAISDHGDALRVDSDVGTVERLFDTALHHMQHTRLEQQATVSLSGEASVPAELAPMLERLMGVYDFPHPIFHLHTFKASPVASAKVQPQQHAFHAMQTEETDQTCVTTGYFNPVVPPNLLVSTYNFADRTTYTTRTNTSAMVTAFGGQAFSTNDLAHFQTNIGYSATFNPTVVNPSNNVNNANAYGYGDEANLDIQALYQISPTSANAFYASTASGSLLSAMQAITAMPASTRPQVVSISYGFGASDYNYYSSDRGRTDSQFQKMGTLGITVIASAGDDGTEGPYNRQCSTSPNSLGYGTISPLSSSPFLPGYPAASPYVLSVGETDFFATSTSAAQSYSSYSPQVTTPPECYNCPADQNIAFICQAFSQGEQPVSYGAQSNVALQTTGGGFSQVYVTPSWQSSFVTGYYGNCTAANGCTLPPSNYYYNNARGYPDVAMFGGFFAIVQNGKEEVVSGTSVSAPLLAGLIARLNEVNLARKGTTLGFINPLLYSIAASTPAAFNDITTGENACPQGNSACATYYQGGGGSTTCSGFYAAPHWDPVSGLGSLNMGALINYLQTH